MSTLKVVNIQHPSAASATLILDSSGNLALPAGSASTPALQGPSDTNTGLFFPAADTIAFAEGGTEVLRIDSSGRVGIGTSSVTNSLHVVGTADTVARLAATSDTNLTFSETTANKHWNIKPSAGDFYFQYSGTAYNSGYSSLLTIKNTGAVGIGTTASPVGASIRLTLDGSNGGGVELVSNNNGGGALVPSAGGGIQFYTHTGAVGSESYSERARIDSSGRWLLGTSSSTSTDNNANNPYLQVEGTTSDAARAALRLNSTTSFEAPVLYLARSRGTTTGSKTLVSSGDRLGTILFEGSDGTFDRGAALIQCEVDATPGAGDMPGRLVFSTTADGASSPTERMRIESSGRICYLPDSSAGSTISSAHPATAGTSSAVFTGSHTATSILGGTTSIRIWNNGNIQNTNNSYTALSDIKLKENIVDANSQWADIKALKVRNYNLKEGQTHKQIGLIAQEVEPISPGLVYESPDRDAEGNDLGTVTKSVNYSVLYMKAVKALQEAMERIEQLEAKVAALENA